MVAKTEGVPQIKTRRITEKDWDKVAAFIRTTLSKRETDSFRKKHERVWKEVDRQISMEPMEAFNNDPSAKGDWHNVVELGELARASEIITADVMRLLFPNNRAWFEAHAELPPRFDSGEAEQEPSDDQVMVDGAIRAFMAQQQHDFGFKERINLSVHEALHHGGFVCEVDEESALKIHDGSGVESMIAPVWKPHSMWNCYPDPSPSLIGTNTFYNGSMIIREYMPLYQLKDIASGEGWMPAQLGKIKKKTNKNKDVETEDVELIKYFGDISIKRQDGDIILPNSEAILANDVIVYYRPSKLAFPRIIYNGYERMDVRDPYYVSPLIKTAPLHKMASKLANKTLDSVDLHVEPPIVYDGNDPNFVANGGPKIAPGAKSSTKGMANFKEIKTGDPTIGLNALSFILDQIRQSTSVDASRAGGGNIVEKTATEARHQAQRGEVRVVDFVDKLEFSLKAFLYMQYEFNKKNKSLKYSFYNPEMDAPDFMWMVAGQLPKNVHFDVVGAKGILGEEERAQKMMGVTAMAASSELFAPLLKPAELLKEAYMDAGAKNPERFIKQPDDDMQMVVEQIQQQAQQVISQYEEKIFELQKDLAIQQAVNGARIEEAKIKAETQADISRFKAELQSQLDILEAQLKMEQANAQNQPQVDVTIREIISAVNDIQKAISDQEKAVNEMANNLKADVEERYSKTDEQITKIMEKANRPMEDRVKEIKMALEKVRQNG